jgi:branched-chain amino acid transport system ATP-binding protein
VIEARGLRKAFGERLLFDNLSFSVPRGAIVGIVGPNGAGKTTLFHALTGTVPVSGGRIVFDGHDVTREPDNARVRRGIARSFQVTSLFANLDVRENLRLAAQGAHPSGAFDMWHRPGRNAAVNELVDSLLDRLGLRGRASVPAAALSHGQQRRLEVGMALAARPRAIFLDEPTSGMGVDDLDGMKALIRGLAQDHTVVLIEHNMNIVMDISDTVTVMQQGRVLVEGTPAAIRDDPRVRAAYLGNMITGGRA